MSGLAVFALVFVLSWALNQWERHECRKGDHEWKGTRGTLEGRHAFVCRRRTCPAEKFEVSQSMPSYLPDDR